MPPTRVVLDTNVLVSAIRSRHGASYRFLSLLSRDECAFEPVVTVPLVVEYEDALLRHAADSHLTSADASDLLDYLVAVSRRQTVFYLWRPVLRNAGDDFVLEAAIAAQASCIVTHNLRDFEASETFGVHVVTPAQFLTQIGDPP